MLAKSERAPATFARLSFGFFLYAALKRLIAESRSLFFAASIPYLMRLVTSAFAGGTTSEVVCVCPSLSVVEVVFDILPSFATDSVSFVVVPSAAFVSVVFVEVPSALVSSEVFVSVVLPAASVFDTSDDLTVVPSSLTSSFSFEVSVVSPSGFFATTSVVLDSTLSEALRFSTSVVSTVDLSAFVSFVFV